MMLGDDAGGQKVLSTEEPATGENAATLFAELDLDYETDRLGTPPCTMSGMPTQELEFWTFGTLIGVILRAFGVRPSRAYLSDS